MTNGGGGPVRFFAEQAKIRARTWRVTVLALCLATLLGILAGAGIGPIVMVLFAGLIRLADLVTGGALAPVRSGLSRFLGDAMQQLGQTVDQLQSGWQLFDPVFLGSLWRFGVLMLPGLVLTAIAYLWLLKHVSRRADDGMVKRFATHPARRGDPVEGECLVLAEELAIAAGIATPSVLITDHPAANLGILGEDHRSWTMLVTSGFAVSLQRNEKRGAMACAVARVVDGDLSVNASVSALGATIGLLRTVLDWPVSRAARSRLWHLGKALFGANRDAAEMERRLLTAGPDRLEELERIDPARP
jgi:hypothetical protein